MDVTEHAKKELLSLFGYVGKKFEYWEEIDKNWGLKINEPLNFSVGTIYAKDYDQAGTAYWFYDGVLSYGMYVWYLLGAVCSVITIKKGRYIGDDSANFVLEENSDDIIPKPSVCSELFTPILNLSMADFNTEAGLVKTASEFLEGVALFSSERSHEYSFVLDDSLFPKHTVDKCELSFDVWQGKVDGIYLTITEKAKCEAKRVVG